MLHDSSPCQWYKHRLLDRSSWPFGQKLTQLLGLAEWSTHHPAEIDTQLHSGRRFALFAGYLQTSTLKRNPDSRGEKREVDSKNLIRCGATTGPYA